MPWILLHQTWQTNLLWWMIPQYQSRDDLHTTTQNLRNKPTLADGPPPSTRAKMTCIPLHKTWQMNLLWLNTMAKVWKLSHSPFLRYPTAFSQYTFLLIKWLTFVPRAPEIPTCNFSGVLNTMAKVWRLYHSPFLRYPTAFSQYTFLLMKWLTFVPRAPEIPTSNFSGVLNTMAKVWKLYHSPFLTYPTAFSQYTFLLRKWLTFVPRAPEIPTSNFSGVLNTMAKVWKL